MQGHYGKLVIRFFLSGGTNRDFMNFTDTMHFYGGLFDTITGLVYSLLFSNLKTFAWAELHDTLKGLDRQDLWGSGYYETRHVINTLFGYAAIVFTGLTARALKSWRAACFAVVILALSPHFVGHSVNNPKDIPFAAAYMISLYYMIRFAQQFPKPRLSTAAGMAAGIAMAINMRIGGLIILFLMWGFMGLAWLLSLPGWRAKMPLPRLLLTLGIVTVLGYFGGLLVWPYGLISPLHNPLKALASMSNFIGAEGKLLFQGRMYLTSELPWYYIPKWILIASPIGGLAGAVVFVVLFPQIRKTADPFLIFMTAFSSFFPWFYVVIKHSILYDGWRHFLFIYPPLVALAALGWDALLDAAPFPRAQAVVLLLFAAAMLEPLTWMARNHPYYSVYFNKLAGGINEAQYNYETDYWGNCIRKASEWLVDYHRREHPGEMAIVGSNASYGCSFPFMLDPLRNSYLPYDPLPPNLKNQYKLNYYIAISRGIKQSDLLTTWPPPRTIYEVKADDATLCSVVDLHNGSSILPQGPAPGT